MRRYIAGILLALVAAAPLGAFAQAHIDAPMPTATGGVIVGDGSTGNEKTITNCVDTGGNHLNFTQATQTWGCGTSIDVDNSVTGTLPVANGGTNVTSSADDNVLVGNGTTWQSKALTSCSAADSAVTYNTSTNAWGCNTITSGVSQTTGTFSATWATGCTTTPSVNFSWSKIGNIVALKMTSNSTTCTSNTTTHTTSGATDLPAAIRPAAEVTFFGVPVTNNGNSTIGCMSLSSGGTIIWELNQTTGGTVECQNNGYTASGTRGIVGTGNQAGTQTFTYTVQ